MTVFLVTSGEYSDYCVVAAFSSRDKAELFCAANERGLDCPEILELQMDEVQVETSSAVLHKWRVALYENGDVSCADEGYTFTSVKKVEALAVRIGKAYRVTITTDKNAGKEIAVKAAQDFLAKWKYEQVEKESV